MPSRALGTIHGPTYIDLRRARLASSRKTEPYGPRAIQGTTLESYSMRWIDGSKRFRYLGDGFSHKHERRGVFDSCLVHRFIGRHLAPRLAPHADVVIFIAGAGRLPALAFLELSETRTGEANTGHEPTEHTRSSHFSRHQPPDSW